MIKKLSIIAAIMFAMFSSAFAEGGSAGAAGSGYSSIIMLVAFIAIFYFLMIRPQMKRSKEHKKMLSSVGKGDEVATNGGVVGKIAKVDDNFIELTISDGVNVKVQKHAVSGLLPKGTVDVK